MSSKRFLLALALLLLAGFTAWLFRTSAPATPAFEDGKEAPLAAVDEIAPAAPIEPERSASPSASWLADLPEPAAPAYAPFGIQPVEFVLLVKSARGPVQGALVRYGPHSGQTNALGEWRWPAFILNGNLVVEHRDFTEFRGWAAEPVMTVRLVDECRLEILVHRGRDIVPDCAVTAWIGGGRWSGRHFDLESYRVASGRTDAEGRFHSAVEYVEMLDGGAGYLEIEVRERDAPAPLFFNVHRSPSQRTNQRETMLYKAAVDLGATVPALRTRAAWVLDDGTAIPAANLDFLYRPAASELSLWRSGRFDAFGEADLSPSFLPLGELDVRTPNGRWWSSAASRVEVRDEQNLTLRIRDRQATVHCTGRALPAGVRLQACQVTFTDEGRNWGRFREVWRDDVPSRVDWQDIGLDSPVALQGGWTGDRIGAAVRALPGGIALACEESEANGLVRLNLPELSLLELDGAHLSAAWAGTSFFLLPSKPTRQLLSGKFFLAAGRAVLVLPPGEYRILASGVNTPKEFSFTLREAHQRESLPWK